MAHLKPFGYGAIAAVLVEISLVHKKAKLVRKGDEFFVVPTRRSGMSHPLAVLDGMEKIRYSFPAHRLTTPFRPAVRRRWRQQ